jgi:uncharacterized protein
MMIPDFPDFIPLAMAAALAGLMRGFSGFGSALLFVPLASLYVEPSKAVILLFVIDGLMALPLLPRALRRCNWREVAPLSAGAAVTVPIGVFFLVSVDPTALRWVLSALALGAVAVLASGWRYHSHPGAALSAVVGSTSGFLGGLASFYGPPIVIFWLGGQSSSATVRANIIVYLAAMAVVAGVSFALYGIFEPATVKQALFLMPAYGVAMWLGARLFVRASEDFFRRLAYLVIAGAVVSSSPAFDGGE